MVLAFFRAHLLAGAPRRPAARPFLAAPVDGRDGIAFHWVDGSTYEQEPLTRASPRSCG
ncbi:MAG: hypothetical protein FJ102_07825 [Deltaproteobacteria bacterium]|nr:hypothetical protein [Deltaproteobacteria bacterium]